ncbi:Hypothetical protein FKW44_007273 [Caligus rogercresseyi]|uniref:Uncharacterized protein n=1 Tax=Caligus rogercresseyi TaxID=217165 RepID=A0A7T8QTG6_CALRO|nr:Hypothetical protein FKW44_007273 [Caligus rogercresseyi]
MEFCPKPRHGVIHAIFTTGSPFFSNSSTNSGEGSHSQGGSFKIVICWHHTEIKV